MALKKLLVVVDMQNDFVDGALGFNGAEKVVEAVVAKIQAAYSDPAFKVLATMDTHQPSYMESREGGYLPVLHCVEGTPGWQLNPKVDAALNAGEHLRIQKGAFGLHAEGILALKAAYGDAFDEIHVCGLVSNICVISNAVVLQSNFQEAKVFVDPAATASYDPRLNALALEVMGGMQTQVVSTADKADNPTKPEKPVLTQLTGAQLKDEMIAWVRDFFEKTGAKGAVVGISGGKDSTVVSTILKETLGADRVFGVLMPNTAQSDIHDSHELVNFIGIPHTVINIGEAYQPLMGAVASALGTSVSGLDSVATINTAPRLRMTTLYAVAAHLGYMVAGTGNRSEGFVGYFTKWGDGAHDFNLLANLTTEQVIAVGHALGLPKHLVEKAPTDGLSGLTDEANLGVTYRQVNTYIAEGTSGDEAADAIISSKHRTSAHKRTDIPKFVPSDLQI